MIRSLGQRARLHQEAVATMWCCSHFSFSCEETAVLLEQFYLLAQHFAGNG